MGDFGKRLRAWRESKGISGWVIEKEIGISRQHLSNVETGRYGPSIAFMEDLASVPQLGLSYDHMRAWHALDHYTLKQLRIAVRESKKLQSETNPPGEYTQG